MRLLSAGVVAALLPSAVALARVVDIDVGAGSFDLLGRPIGGAKAATGGAAYLQSSRIAAAGDGALVIDADSGNLIRTDREGESAGQLAIGRDAGYLAFDPDAGLAYVADRRGDRVVVASVGDKLAVARTIKTPVEPYGVALTPDRKTLLVTTVADRALVAYDAATGAERWRTPLGREPRGIAVSPDGARALVAYLATGTVDQIDLAETHRAEHIAIANGVARHCRHCGTDDAPTFARGSFALTFMGPNQAVIPYQRETPVQATAGAERTGSYGGGFDPPVTHDLAFVGFTGRHATQVSAEIAQHQPRSLAWDASHDALYVAGMGTDTLLQVRDASQITIAGGATVGLAAGAKRCGPDGVAIAPGGNVLVWCSFSRTVARVSFVDGKGELASDAPVATGPSVVASAMTPAQHDGLVLFHSAEPRISQRGSLACATCHPDARTDGLSWRIEKHDLQTPLLQGRVTNTGPFKWDGTDATLMDSMTSTMKRLGGIGLDHGETASLAAYLEALPPIRTPVRDAGAVARGAKLFDAEGCRTCHDGRSYTDQERHKLTGTLAQSDTPSLLGLAASAPYFHDGSAATLEALLRDRGAVHGMAETSKLTDAEVKDLTAFLETL